MAEILIGLAAGLAVAAAVLLGYRRGLTDGRGGKETPRGNHADATQEQDALMKKYEAILEYDPYGERV